MAQRKSGYERQEADWYPTPAWVVAALAEHMRLTGLRVWEPAAADGQLAEALAEHGASVWESDVRPGKPARTAARQGTVDFLTAPLPDSTIEAICTNPPWGAGG